MEWTPEIKLALLFSSGFLIITFLFVILMMHTLGSLSNLLQHIQDLVQTESSIRLSQYMNMLKQNKQRQQNIMDNKKRQEALLNIPLVHKPQS